MNPTLRYWLFQIPGVLILVVVLVPLTLYDLIEFSTAVLIVLFWILKDAIMFPFLRDSYRVEDRQGAAALIDKQGVLESDLSPRGWLRLRGELWQARVAEGAPHLTRGEIVRVIEARGMVLFVEKPGSDPEHGDGIYGDTLED